MSLAIDVDKVTRILLADGWHDVTDSSFYLDAYEFGQVIDDPRECSGTRFDSYEIPPVPGFGCTAYNRESRHVHLAGPLASILAVEMTE